ncbi:hypothetical protein [Flavobacterium macrobrachii]|uniref:Uncharacterized protein n=1 Tax=Flavobacterium macrobrachii TaxID=591204 RepID=A0ABS2CUF1_9FLAO|nr:hypothetical protein [Flavobacterium macrobrachii]MBM6498602.1 hypothetical protein [Flavobacterium macrobrachii]
MKKYLFLLLISTILFSCKKEDEDDSYKYLYDKLSELIERDRNVSESTYLQKYYDIKNDNNKRIRFDSMFKISKNIEKKFEKLNFLDKKSVIKFRDSVLIELNLPLKSISENDKLLLNDSVFKKKMELDILSIRECYHYLYIYDRKEPL